MNNIERPVDDNSTVSIQDNEKMKQVERKETKKQKKSGITIRELTIIGLLAGITIATTYIVPSISIFSIFTIMESTARSTHHRICFHGYRIPYNYGYGAYFLALRRYVCC